MRCSFLLFAMTGLLFGCQSKTQSAEIELTAESQLTEAEKTQVVARIGDRVITLEEFEKRLSGQSPFARARYSNANRKRELLDSLVRFELIAMEAERKGYGKHQDVVLARKQAMVRQFTAQELGQLVKMSDIDDVQLRAYYDGHPTEFNRPAQVRGAHILVASDADARALLKKLEASAGLSEAARLKAFADLARTESTDADTRERGGDLHFFGEPGVSKVVRGDAAPQVVTPVAKAAYGLANVGDWTSEPLKSSQGWHIVQKTAVRRAYTRDFNIVKNKIRNKLFRQKKHEAMEAYVSDLKSKSKIEIDDAVLEKAKNALKAMPPKALQPPGDLKQILREGGKK